MALRQKGFRVLRRAVYEAVSIASLPVAAETHLRHRDVRAAMFFSAETARHFVRLIRAAKLDEVLVELRKLNASRI